MSISSESCGGLTYMSTEQIKIHSGCVTGVILPVRFIQRAVKGKQRERSDSCGHVINLNKKWKLNVLKERPSVKNASTHIWPRSKRDIAKADLD